MQDALGLNPVFSQRCLELHGEECVYVPACRYGELSLDPLEEQPVS